MTTDTRFPPLKNNLVIEGALGKWTPRAGCWIMRQAGRYLPEFRAVRAQHDFFTVCRTPELATEVTMQPIRRYRGLLGASIIFSDILVVPQAMGLEVLMLDGKEPGLNGKKGPHFPEPLEDPSHLARLPEKVDVQKELHYVYDAITMTRKALDGEVPLIGFCGAPWTLMAYMVGGRGTEMEKPNMWLRQYPEESKALLHRVTDVCIAYLVEQVRAGAQLLQVFDSWAGEMSEEDFRTFALPYLRKISTGLRSTLGSECVPLIVFARGALGHSLDEVARSGYDVVALDQGVPPAHARKIVDAINEEMPGHRVALQGNADPGVLLKSKEEIDSTVKAMIKGLDGFGGSGAYVCNLGHGITPEVDPEHLRAFLEAVEKYSTEAATEAKA